MLEVLLPCIVHFHNSLIKPITSHNKFPAAVFTERERASGGWEVGGGVQRDKDTFVLAKRANKL
jgi:hypothetical protein